MARVEEAYSERDEAIDAKGNVTEVEIPYLVFNVRDESEALAAVRASHKAVSGMSLASVKTVERVNGDTWKVKAVYEADEDGESSSDATEIWSLFSRRRFAIICNILLRMYVYSADEQL